MAAAALFLALAAVGVATVFVLRGVCEGTTADDRGT